MKRVIVVNSAKGGVGKTMVSEGIAIELIELGHDVAVIDLDVTTPNMKQLEGVKLYAPPTGGQMTKSQTKKFLKRSVDDCGGGWIIIDTPPTISSAYSAITETINNARFIFVTTPSKNAILDTGVGVKFFATRGVVASGLIQNMVGDTFGLEFDSEAKMGIKTIGVIPLSDDASQYFSKIVGELNKLDFMSASTSGDARKIMSTLTVHEAKKDKNLPVRFYNLETWDYMREKILDKEAYSPEIKGSIFGGKSHYDISTDALSKIIDCGDTATVVMGLGVHVEKSPLPHEIQEVTITYDNPVSKGLPMFVLNNGVNLWHHECSLADDALIKETLDSGGIELGEGRILQSLHSQVWLSRAYTRATLDEELILIKKHIEIGKLNPTKKDLIYSQYILGSNRKEVCEYDVFDMDEYVEGQEKSYPDFHTYLLSLLNIGEQNNEQKRD